MERAIIKGEAGRTRPTHSEEVLEGFKKRSWEERPTVQWFHEGTRRKIISKG